MILRAAVVVTMTGPPIKNGAVVVSRDRIAAVGPWPELRTHHTGAVTDLQDQVLLPGLINAHCHLDYTRLRGAIRPQKSFADWIRAINAERAAMTQQDYLVSIRDGLTELKRFGTTSVVNLTGFPELANSASSPLRVSWCAELMDLRSPHEATGIVDGAVRSLQSVPQWGLAPHAPFTASPALYRQCESVAREANALLTTHLAESAEEMEMAVQRRGELREFLDSLGVSLFAANGRSPVEHIIESVNQLDERWLLVHLNCVTDGDLHLLARQRTRPHIVHCPRSHAYFRHPDFRFDRLRQSGFNVCLGTDSLASNADLSLFAEMRAFQQMQPMLGPDQILELVTVKAALAMRQGERLGRIATGLHADMIALPCRNDLDIYEQIVAWNGDVPWHMVGGMISSA